jgi:hypothetical protein
MRRRVGASLTLPGGAIGAIVRRAGGICDSERIARVKMRQNA